MSTDATPAPTPRPVLTAMQLLSAALRKPTFISGRITGMRNTEGKWIAHAAVELTTVQLMGTGTPQTMTVMFEEVGLNRLIDSLIELDKELRDTVAQAARLATD